MLTPRTWASRALNSRSSLPKAAISVGQTKVKSFGQKNTTCHLPGKLSWVKDSNALAGSLDTTPFRANWGNGLPIPDIFSISLGVYSPRGGKNGGCPLQDPIN